MNSGVFYLLTGPGHGVRLVVSLASLRRHYSGPVIVYTTQAESHVIGALCAKDSRLQVEHRKFPQAYRRKNAAFLTKLSLLEHVPFDVALHLDADTLIAGDISPLFAGAATSQFAATQFSDWKSTTRNVRRRIENWRTVRQSEFSPAAWEDLIDSALEPHPAVNGGVFAYRRDAEILDPWYRLAVLGKRTFICDEIALQILIHRYRHTILDCRWNCSPIYGKRTEDARIWHMHGEKHLRPEALPRWWPAYQQCVEDNIANLAEWTPAHDSALLQYLDTQVRMPLV